MTLLATERVKGSVHDLSHAQTLDPDDCNVLFVSSRTLFILQNLAQSDAAFLTRYAAEYVGSDLYRTPETQIEIDDVWDIANNAVLEVSPVTCDLASILQGISAQLGALGGASCGCDVGTDTDSGDGEAGGSPPGSVNGVPYEEPDPIVDRKCKASNYVHNSVRDSVDELDKNRVDTYLYAGVAVMVSLVTTIVLGVIAGPFGLLVGAVIGSWLGMAALLFKGSVNLGDLYDAIVDDESLAICALYEAQSADDARVAYLAVLSSAGASSIELEFAGYLLTNNVLNLLFFEWGDSADAIDAATITHDCTDCCSEADGFFTIYEGTVTSGSFNLDGVPFTVTGEDIGAYWRFWFDIQQPVGCPCVDYNIEVTATGGAIGGPAGQIQNCATTDVWRYDVQGYGALIDTWPGRLVVLAGTATFTVTFEITII